MFDDAIFIDINKWIIYINKWIIDINTWIIDINNNSFSDINKYGLNVKTARHMAHLLFCRLLDEACTADDLVTVTERAKACARKWENIVWMTRQKKI